MSVRHGHYLGYIADGCHCDDCRRAWQLYQKYYKLRTYQGRVWVDAAVVLDHLGPLLRIASPSAVARAAGVEPWTLLRVVRGEVGRVQRRTAEALMGVTVRDLPRNAFIDAAPARRLIAELVASGVPRKQIARCALGWKTWPGRWPRDRVTVETLVRLWEFARRSGAGVPVQLEIGATHRRTETARA